MKSATPLFHPLARLLHWLMAVLLLSMLFIGVGMVSSLAEWQPRLVAVHKPLGLALLCLVVVRSLVRLTHPAPALPGDLPRVQRLAAHLSHLLLYGLMFALPLVGWAMQGAAGYPLVLAGHAVPTLVAQDADLYALLRAAHGYLAYLLFATVLLHLAAALYHGLIRRDGVLSSMLGRRSSVDRPR